MAPLASAAAGTKTADQAAQAVAAGAEEVLRKAGAASVNPPSAVVAAVAANAAPKGGRRSRRNRRNRRNNY